MHMSNRCGCQQEHGGTMCWDD